QADIMEFVRKWAAHAPVPGTRLTGMDYFVMGLRQTSFNITHFFVQQQRTAFDEMHRRMSAENVEEFKRLVAASAGTFKKEKPSELVEPEFTKEDFKRGAKVGLEAGLAVATGGGSLLFQLGLWLAKMLPGLWEKAKAVIDLIQAVRSLKKEDVANRLSGAALG